jgi:hypothetical protein
MPTIACMQIKVTDMQMKVLANYDNFFFFITCKPKIIKCRCYFNVIIEVHNFM